MSVIRSVNCPYCDEKIPITVRRIETYSACPVCGGRVFLENEAVGEDSVQRDNPLFSSEQDPEFVESSVIRPSRVIIWICTFGYLCWSIKFYISETQGGYVEYSRHLAVWLHLLVGFPLFLALAPHRWSWRNKIAASGACTVLLIFLQLKTGAYQWTERSVEVIDHQIVNVLHRYNVSRWDGIPFYESRYAYSSPTQTGEGHLSASGKRHGRWEVWKDLNHSDVWYFEDEEVTEAEFYRRNNR